MTTLGRLLDPPPEMSLHKVGILYIRRHDTQHANHQDYTLLADTMKSNRDIPLLLSKLLLEMLEAVGHVKFSMAKGCTNRPLVKHVKYRYLYMYISISMSNARLHQLVEGPLDSQVRDENTAMRGQDSITSDAGSCRRPRRDTVRPYPRQNPITKQPATTTATSRLLLPPSLRLRDLLKTFPPPLPPPRKLTTTAATRRRSCRSAWYATRPSRAAE